MTFPALLYRKHRVTRLAAAPGPCHTEEGRKTAPELLQSRCTTQLTDVPMALWSCRLQTPPSSGGPVNIQRSLNGRRRVLSYCKSPVSQPAQEKPFTSNGALKSVQDWSKVTSRHEWVLTDVPSVLYTDQRRGVKSDEAPQRTLQTGKN